MVLCKHKKALPAVRLLAPGCLAASTSSCDPACWRVAYQVSSSVRPAHGFSLADDCRHRAGPGKEAHWGNRISLGGQVNVDHDALPAAGKGGTDTAQIFKPDDTI